MSQDDAGDKTAAENEKQPNAENTPAQKSLMWE